jgi:hypothetical protein
MARFMTLGEYMIGMVGFRKSAQVQGLLVAWAMWLRTHDGVAPTIDVLAGGTERSRAQWFRDLATFRQVFPAEKSPDRIVRLLLADLERKPTRILSVPMASLLGPA